MVAKPRCIVCSKAIMGKVGKAPADRGNTLPYCQGKHTKIEITASVQKALANG